MSTANLLACNYGTASMEMVGYSLAQDAEVRDQFGRIGTRLRMIIKGMLYGTSTSDIEAKAAAIIGDLSIDGRDLTITGAGGTTELTIAAAACQYGGPFPSIVMEDGEAPFTKKFTLTVIASQILNGGLPRDNYTLSTQKHPDGLLVVTRQGRIIGANTAPYFLSTTVASFRRSYALPDWTVDFTYEASQDAAQSQVNYHLTARQLASPLPAASANDQAVDGTASRRQDRDEQLRLTTTIEADVLIAGDPMAVLAEIRPNDGSIITRESVTITTIPQTRLRCEFVIVDSADPDHGALLSFNQELQYHPAADVYEEKNYIGADPILILRASTLPRITQSGSATALGKFFKQPDPLFQNHSDAPQFNYSDTNNFERQTNWSYQSFGVDENGNPFDPNWIPPVMGIAREQQPDDYVGEVGEGSD